MTIYRIIIRLVSGNAIHCRFFGKVPAEVMKRLCEEDFVGNRRVVDVHCLDVTHMKYPDLSTPSPQNRKWKWCPTCGKYGQRFRHNSHTRCDICWCSSISFDFKKANNTWYADAYKSRRRRVKVEKSAIKSLDEQRELKRQKRRERRLAKKRREGLI